MVALDEELDDGTVRGSEHEWACMGVSGVDSE